MWPTVVLLVALSGLGLPFVLLLGRNRSSLPSLLVEAAALGLAISALEALALVHTGHFGRPILFASLGATWALANMAVLLREGWDFAAARPDLRNLRSFSTLTLIAIAVSALFLRRHPAYFTYEIGDMAAYVNSANQFFTGLVPGNTRPHLLMAALAVSKAFLGEKHTVSLLPAMGMIFIGLAWRLGDLFRIHIWHNIIIVSIVSFSTIFIWFSLFPVSESLFALLSLGTVVFLAKAEIDNCRGSAIVAGFLTGAQILTRVDAVATIPAILLVFLCAAVMFSRRQFLIVRLFTFTSLASFALFFGYTLVYLRGYYTSRLYGKLGDRASDIVARSGVLVSPIRYIFIMLSGVLVLVLVSIGAQWIRGRYLRASGPRLFNHIPGLVLLICAVGLATIDSLSGLIEALTRYGILTLAAVLAGIVFLVVRGWEGPAPATICLSIAQLSIAVYLFADAFPVPRNHAFYLYWDRYLYGNAVTALVLLAIIAAVVVQQSRVSGQDREDWWLAASVVAASAALVPVLFRSAHISSRPLFGDAYAQLQALERATSLKGEYPVVFSGPDEPPPGWPFPNTFRAFATPMDQSQVRRVLNVTGRDPFSPDPTPTLEEIAQLMHDQSLMHVYLIRMSAESLTPVHTRVGVELEHVESLAYRIPVLPRRTDRLETFAEVTLYADVTLVSLATE